MSVILKGTSALTLESENRSWTQATGWESTYRYKGTWANVEAALNGSAYVQNASRIDARQEAGGYGVLEVSFAAEDNTDANVQSYQEETDTWTLQPSKYQANIWEHPYFDSLDDSRQVYTSSNNSASTLRGTKYRIRTAVEAYLAGVQANFESNTKDDSKVDLHDKLKEWDTGVNLYGGLSDAQKQIALDLVLMLLAGKDTYETSRYILRNTKVVPGNTNLSLSHFQVESQWTTPEVVAYITDNSIASVSKFALIGDIANTFWGSSSADKSYWFKEAPVIHEVQGGKFEVVQEWVNYKYGELSSLLYPYYGRA